jgi:hypothetical protein
MDAEFKQKLLEERAMYQSILNPTTQYLSMHCTKSSNLAETEALCLKSLNPTNRGWGGGVAS